MLPDEFIIEHPEVYGVGSKGVLVPPAAAATIKAIQTERKSRKYKGRAFLSSSYNIRVSRGEAVHCQTTTGLILIGAEPQSWQIRIGKTPVGFLLERDRTGHLQSAMGYAVADLPSKALDVFKSAVFHLVDHFAFVLKVPLYIQRTELYLEDEMLMVELTFPAEEALLQCGSTINVASIFRVYRSLEREAICSPSSIYRFMCRWRAFESIGAMRHSIRKVAEEVGCKARMPKVPVLTRDLRSALRLHDKCFARARNVEAAVRCFQDLRDSVAHFWSGNKRDAQKGTIVPYRALDVTLCEKASQVIGYCNRAIVQDLWDFCREHLSDGEGRGAILASPGQEEEFPATQEVLRLYREGTFDRQPEGQ